MKPLAPNEKFLLVILCGAVFVALNLIGLRSFLQAQTKVAQGISTAKSDLSADQSLLDLVETFRPGMDWIARHPMPQMSPDDASAQLLKLEQTEVEKANLKATEENLLPTEAIPGGSSVGVAVKISGPFEGVVRLLFALQSPTAWRSLDKLTLRSDTQPPNVIADLELRQYFQPGAGTTSTPAPAKP